jgi:hypothetical protein
MLLFLDGELPLRRKGAAFIVDLGDRDETILRLMAGPLRRRWGMWREVHYRLRAGQTKNQIYDLLETEGILDTLSDLEVQPYFWIDSCQV